MEKAYYNGGCVQHVLHPGTGLPNYKMYPNAASSSRHGMRPPADGTISLGDDADYANFLGFRGLVTLLPNFCQLSVPEVGVCGVYSESP